MKQRRKKQKPDHFPDLSNDEIDSDNHLNGQRSNYLFSQSRHTQSVIKKQRSLTPDKSSDDQSQLSKRYINSDKRSITKNSSIESQGSVYLKSSSSSRSSILDRQRHEDSKFISSRSSSTSSFSGGEQEQLNFNRSRYRQPPQESQLATGSRIRRSRYLILLTDYQFTCYFTLNLNLFKVTSIN